MKITLHVNHEARTAEAPASKRLLDLLREDLRLTGTKEGCGEGECGACTVLLDGEPVNSCLVAAGQCHGRSVVTVEGLAEGARGAEVLHAVQRALVERGGAQCGICTPGIAVCAAQLVDGHALAAAGGDDGALRVEIRRLLAGNICRCTGYQLIVEAVVDAVRALAALRGERAASAGPEVAR